MTPPRQSPRGGVLRRPGGWNHARRACVVQTGLRRPLEESDMINRIRRRRAMTFLARTRRRAQKMSPYLSLVLLLVPVALVEPLKLAALIFAGKGHWMTGTAVLLGAYAASLFFVERLFRMVKPKLMTLNWFATLWTWVITLRDKALTWARGKSLSEANRTS
jgi:hypothetical protein